MSSDEPVRVYIKKLEVVAFLVGWGLGSWTARLGSSFRHVPDNELVSVLYSAETYEVSFIRGKRQGLNVFVVITYSVEHLSLRKVPDYHSTDDLRTHLLSRG